MTRMSGHVTKEKLLQSSVFLFLKQGYQGTTLQAIAKNAGLTTGAIFQCFSDKEGILHELIATMFGSQFAAVEAMLAGNDDPVLLYAAETALQLHITELSESLRDVYVTAYSLPTTSEYIYRMTAKKLAALFAAYLPKWEEKDFYEIEIASAGIVRGYMARQCDMYFTIEQKVRRFLETSLVLYRIPEDQIRRATDCVLTMDLHDLAEKVIAGASDSVSQQLAGR